MNHPARRTACGAMLACVALAAIAALAAPAGAAPAAVELQLREQLGLTWSHELVHQRVSLAPGDLTGRAIARVTGPDGNPVVSQTSDVTRRDDGSIAAMNVWFFVDLSAGETRTYNIEPGVEGPAPAPGQPTAGVRMYRARAAEVTTLELVTQPQNGPELVVRLLAGSGQSQQRYPTPFSEAPGLLAPVQSIIAGETLIARGSVHAPFTVGSFEGRVIANGPLFAEVEQTYELEEGHWQLRFRAVAGSPMVQVYEQLNTGHSGQASQQADRFWSLTVAGDDFKPQQMWYSGWVVKGDRDDLAHKLIPETWKATGGLPRDNWVATPVSGATIPDEPQLLYALTGWPTAQVYLGNLVRLVQPGSLSLGLTSLRAMDWRNPMSVRVARDDAGRLRIKLPIQMYNQHWPIDGFGAGSPNYTGLTRFAPPNEARRSYGIVVTPAEDEKDSRLESLSSLTKKFAAQPLDEVKDWTLTWPDPLEGSITATEPTEAGLAALEMMRSRVKLHHIAGNLSTYSNGNHQWFAKSVYPKIKPVIDDPAALPPDMRQELRALLAFEAYRMHSGELFPLGSGLHLNNPNMTIMAIEARAKAAMLVKDHPRALDWGRESVALMRDYFSRYTFPSGIPYENPHYTLGVTMEWALQANALLMELGAGDGLDTPLFRRSIEVVLNWLTPPDLRFNGHRTALPLGNGSYQSIPDGLARDLVTYLKDKDPELAAKFQWAANQTLEEKRQVDIVESVRPELGSTWIKDHGVAFRHGFGTEHETLFYLLAGKTFGHYELETDHMAYTLYAKGHPIHLHFGNGYFPILNRPWMRNRVSFDMSIEAWERSRIDVADATLLPQVEYARAFREVEALWPLKKEVPTLREGTVNQWDDETNTDWRESTTAEPQPIPLTIWQRQVAFIKDADPAGPNYFVLRDTFEGTPTRPTHLNLWFLSNDMQRQGDVFHFDGQVKVDMDVFMHTPESPEMHTDSYWHRQQPYIRYTGFDPKWHPDGKLGETQQLLRVGQSAGEGYLVVLYPRLKDVDAPAAYERLGENAVRIKTPLSTDTVLLAVAPAELKTDRLTVTSRAAVLREFNDGRVSFTNLEGPCSLTVGDTSYTGRGGFTAEFKDGRLHLTQKEDDATLTAN